MPPRALEPAGLIIADKPAGPSSFAMVARSRNRTRARTGHAGTLDPFATGLLLLLSGRATRLAARFVGLDKRYLTEIDLSGRTTTGDVEGEPLDSQAPPTREALEHATREQREREAVVRAMREQRERDDVERALMEQRRMKRAKT